MKESKFVEQNKHKWIEFSGLMKSKESDPMKLSKLFVQVSDDLSYARTFYKNRKVRVLLNNISQFLFNGIYKNNRITISDIINFWRNTLPTAMWNARRELLFAFTVFAISFLIGMVSSANDINFTKLILGEDYINKTIENIKKNEPMGVYKYMGEFDMMFRITLNNLRVSIITFVSGVLAALGSIFTLFYNGIMVGSFQYFFVQRGLFLESFLTIWQHGTLEISSIIIAGASGITLGKGILFPGTYSRAQSFRLAAKRGMTIFAGIVPVLILAAFIESFFTRYTDMNIWVRLSVILFSFTFILGYFVIYPWRLARKGKISGSNYSEIVVSSNDEVDIESFINDSSNLEMVFTVIKQRLGALIKLITGVALAFTVSVLIASRYILDPSSNPYIPIIKVFDSDDFRILFLLSSFVNLVFIVLLYSILRGFFKLNPEMKKVIFFLKTSYLSVTTVGFSYLAISFESWITWLVMLFFLPFSSLINFVALKKNLGFLKAMQFALKLLGAAQGKFWSIIGQALAITVIALFLMRMSIFNQYFQMILWNINLNSDYIELVVMFIEMFFLQLFIGAMLSLIIISASVSFFVMNEVFTAENLIEKINLIGKSKRTRGYERE